MAVIIISGHHYSPIKDIVIWNDVVDTLSLVINCSISMDRKSDKCFAVGISQGGIHGLQCPNHNYYDPHNSKKVIFFCCRFLFVLGLMRKIQALWAISFESLLISNHCNLCAIAHHRSSGFLHVHRELNDLLQFIRSLPASIGNITISPAMNILIFGFWAALRYLRNSSRDVILQESAIFQSITSTRNNRYVRFQCFSMGHAFKCSRLTEHFRYDN